jgi:hypothetical protein
MESINTACGIIQISLTLHHTKCNILSEIRAIGGRRVVRITRKSGKPREKSVIQGTYRKSTVKAEVLLGKS